jgi:hypothetical protein
MVGIQRIPIGLVLLNMLQRSLALVYSYYLHSYLQSCSRLAYGNIKIIPNVSRVPFDLLI